VAEPRISFDALAGFAAFAETLNLTKAAAAPHISQPSLPAKIGTLSREPGRPLYAKVCRRLVLTPDGEQVARFAREQSGRIGRLMDELAAASGMPRLARPPVTAASGMPSAGTAFGHRGRWSVALILVDCCLAGSLISCPRQTPAAP
jgi:DNA-binding transcriptional LysR family regulator